MLTSDLPVSLKRRIRRHLNRSSIWWHTHFHPFSRDDLSDALVELGLSVGDVAIAHVAFNKFRGFSGSPSEVIVSLRSALTNKGTLLMPSIPFTGTALGYVRSGQMFDVRRTPSQMGIVTELFRRSPGTIRSLHPTHPILAEGPAAVEVSRDHPAARTPCGVHSPLAKLADMGGKIALLGTGIGVMTFYHYLEEELEQVLPKSPFTREIFEIPFHGPQGELMRVSTRLYDPDCSANRNLGILEENLRRRGMWREKMLGRVAIVLLDTGAVAETIRDMAAEGVFCYG